MGMEVSVADPVQWFGVNTVEKPGCAGTRPPCSVGRCKTTSERGARIVLLPCRWEWCGCGRTDTNGSNLVLSYPESKDGKPSCAACGTRVEEAVDLNRVFVTQSHNSSLSDDGNSCSICLNEPARVVNLPCNHLTACSACAHRLTKAVPRRSDTGPGVHVSSQCPQCRSVLRSMVVVTDEQMSHCTSRSAEYLYA